MLKKSKILLFIDWYMPAFKAGGPIQSCVNFVENMKTYYEILIVTGDTDFGETQKLEGISSNVWIDLGDNVKIIYASKSFITFKSIKRIIHAEQPDFIYLNSMFSQNFTLLPLFLKKVTKIGAKYLLNPRGMLRESAMKFKSSKKRYFIGLFKFLRIYRDINFLATDLREAMDIKKYFPDAGVSIIPNFSTCSKFNTSILEKKRGELKLLFVGRIHPIKQLSYLLNVLQNVQGVVVLTIVGIPEDLEYWKQCQKQINNFPSSIKVNELGGIPHYRLEQLYFDNHLFCLPTLGENFGHAIFESLSAGTPVLISDQTPWHNLLNSNAGWDLSLSDPTMYTLALQAAIDWTQDDYLLWSKGARIYIDEFNRTSDTLLMYRNIFA